MQNPANWMTWPSRPVNLYRVTQGLHVMTGLAAVPLLLAKLWTVYPRLLQWPPARSAGHAIERLMVFVLVGGSLFQLVTGVMNIDYWYAFRFFFTTAHYDNYPAVLVRMEAVDREQLAELIEDAWRLQAPKKLVTAYDAGE